MKKLILIVTVCFFLSCSFSFAAETIKLFRWHSFGGQTERSFEFVDDPVDGKCDYVLHTIVENSIVTWIEYLRCDIGEEKANFYIEEYGSPGFVSLECFYGKR